ncbi:hypothetical protein, partial [Salmonella enterica]|uniref:hypothetical protein n=1 Tax=Salmonella enterica TaxID=28901 RepID=UPI001F3E5F26
RKELWQLTKGQKRKKTRHSIFLRLILNELTDDFRILLMLTIFIYSTPPAIFPKYILDII